MQGTLQAGGGPKRYVRFGSAKFAAAVLPEDQQSKLLQQVGFARILADAALYIIASEALHQS